MFRIIERVVAACSPVPVTAKIRFGCTRDTVNAIEVAQVVEAAGAAALTVHGRTAQDFFKGSADWDRIAEIKPHLKRIPLIGNGDLASPAAVIEAFRRYPVDGVMIARAALSKPWLFQQVHAALARPADSARSDARRGAAVDARPLPPGLRAFWRSEGNDFDAEICLLLRPGALWRPAFPHAGDACFDPGRIPRRGRAVLSARRGGRPAKTCSTAIRGCAA